MQLINTMEINPYDFSDKEYDSSSIESPERRNQFWKRCISDKNLGRLEAIREGSYLVDITTIHDEELAEILKYKLEEVDLSDFEEQVGRIRGGVALKENDTMYLEPTCCGDLGSIEEWESIFEKEPNAWHQLWIGHPWIYYKRNNGTIAFSDYTEDFNAIEILVSVSELELQMELRKIRTQQNDFESSIRRVLGKMGMVHAERIAQLMTGNV
jgi:hypothetical protein